jgi:hypothetical protein
MDERTQRVVHLIQSSDLDQTIKDILIRDLQAEGFSEFLVEQIKAYCLSNIEILDEQIELAKKDLQEAGQQVPENPA